MLNYSEQYRTRLLDIAKRYQKPEEYLFLLNPIRKLSQLIDADFSGEELDLLFTGYHKVISHQRSITRDSDGIPGYEIQRLQGELIPICKEAIAAIDNRLIPSSTNTESLVRYLSKKGDYYRYLAEIKTVVHDQKEMGIRSMEAYKKATELAEAELEVTNEVRLGAALNMTVLLYEVMGREISAIELAENAYNKAALEIEREKTSEKSKIIWNLLLGNVALWTARLPPDVFNRLEA